MSAAVCSCARPDAVRGTSGIFCFRCGLYLAADHPARATARQLTDVEQEQIESIKRKHEKESPFWKPKRRREHDTRHTKKSGKGGR